MVDNAVKEIRLKRKELIKKRWVRSQMDKNNAYAAIPTALW